MLIAAGLLARKARQRGLAPPAWVKTSLGPGSPAAASYLKRSGLLDDLEALGFGIVGFGCTTCIGNSGPLVPEMAEAIQERGVVAAAVLSGNRNFPGRVHALVDHAFLASPPLVVAFGLAGSVDLDISREPVGRGRHGEPVFLKDLWPGEEEIAAAHAEALDADDFVKAYADVGGGPAWAALEAPTGRAFPVGSPLDLPPAPAVRGAPKRASGVEELEAQPLIVLGDDITTDHISPAGAIPPKGEAGAYLIAAGEDPNDLNVFSSRRGNYEAMVRGLFTNRSVRNLLAPEAPPGWTVHAPSGELLPLYRAAERYRAEGVPTVILAGRHYGSGSSRDWAAKGPALLGVRAVLARSFERIHRSNLIGMGILPLELPTGYHPASLALRPGDRIELAVDFSRLAPSAEIPIRLRRASGESIPIHTRLLIETSLDSRMLAAGGLIPLVLDRHLRGAVAPSRASGAGLPEAADDDARRWRVRSVRRRSPSTPWASSLEGPPAPTRQPAFHVHSSTGRFPCSRILDVLRAAARRDRARRVGPGASLAPASGRDRAPRAHRPGQPWRRLGPDGPRHADRAAGGRARLRRAGAEHPRRRRDDRAGPVRDDEEAQGRRDPGRRPDLAGCDHHQPVAGHPWIRSRRWRGSSASTRSSSCRSIHRSGRSPISWPS